MKFQAPSLSAPTRCRDHLHTERNVDKCYAIWRAKVALTHDTMGIDISPNSTRAHTHNRYLSFMRKARGSVYKSAASSESPRLAAGHTQFRTSQGTHSVSMATTNRLMLFRETVSVYCDNHTEHTDKLCGQKAVYINSVRTSQETHYVSATKPNRLMLFRETVAVYCENLKEHKDTLCGHKADITLY
jgi:hypothetical protein